MDVAELEGIAVEAHERAGSDPERPWSTFRLARALLGPGAVVRPTSIAGAPAATYTLNGQRTIAVKARLPIAYAAFFCGHELAHVFLEKYVGDDLEPACDYLGAALVAPRPAVIRAHRAHGFDLAGHAAEFVATQTLCALRVGEVLRLPLAVVAPTVRVRGPEEWVWPDERTLRAWARRPPPGLELAKTRLTDDPGRVVLRAV